MMPKYVPACLTVALVLALPTAVWSAVVWDGDAGNGVWADPANWAEDALPTNVYYTEEARVDYVTTPVIADGNETEWDRGRIKGSTVTQTGGSHRWRNYTSSNGLGIHRDTAILHMTGGIHYADRVVVGGSIYTTSPTAAADGIGIIEIWGEGTFVVEPNTYTDPASDIYQVHHLWILDGGSKIDIRENGKLRVPADMVWIIDDYINAGKIVAGEADASLATALLGEEYVISIAGSGGLLGDLSGDGTVGSADLDIVRANWGQSVDAGCLPCGDPSGDGVVGSADLDVVRANWGRRAASAASVPEPGMLTLLLGGVLLVGVLRRSTSLSA